MVAEMPGELDDFARDLFDDVIAMRVDSLALRYADTPETLVFVEGPRWATWGAEAVATGWRALAESSIRLTSIRWVDGPVGQAGGGAGWFGGIIDVDYVADGSPGRIRFRSTHVVRALDGAWRIVHEHVSTPHPDPYGAGDWLRAEDTTPPNEEGAT